MNNFKAFLIGLGFGWIAVGMLPFLIAICMNESMDMPNPIVNPGKGERISADRSERTDPYFVEE